VTVPEPLQDAPSTLTPPQTQSYRRLTQSQLGIVLALHKEGKTQVQIAEAIGCHQTSVSQALERLGVDTIELAKHRATSSAYKRVARMDAWSKKRDSIGLKAAQELNQIAGLTGTIDSKGVNVAVQVVIGMPNQPAGPDPLSLVVSSSKGESAP
jgi:hypothetical protein